MMLATATGSLVDLRLHESCTLQQQLAQDAEFKRLLAAAADAMALALRHSGKILFFGNGGSAADAQHLAAELTGRFRRERRGLAALALTTNTSALTAIGNDYEFDMVFERLIDALGNAGDVAVAISTSGNSRNVLRAVKAADQKGMVTIGLTGRTGGELKGAVDYCLCMPSDDTPRVQEGHILAGHILCEMVEEALFG